jgi:hypothetical protein
MAEDAVEEGRVALRRLENQMGSKQNMVDSSCAFTAGRKNERRLLGKTIFLFVSSSFHDVRENFGVDQIPRYARLTYRNDSPLGLTVEELDDRGLLDGGSVPSYYTSMKQKDRRSLEMRNRSSRLQEREQKVCSILIIRVSISSP